MKKFITALLAITTISFNVSAFEASSAASDNSVKECRVMVSNSTPREVIRVMKMLFEQKNIFQNGHVFKAGENTKIDFGLDYNKNINELSQVDPFGKSIRVSQDSFSIIDGESLQEINQINVTSKEDALISIHQSFEQLGCNFTKDGFEKYALEVYGESFFNKKKDNSVGLKIDSRLGDTIIFNSGNSMTAKGNSIVR